MEVLTGARTLEGRTALVTGAARGIGRAISRELAKSGAKVILVGRDAGSLELAAREICEGGGLAVAMPANVRERGWLDALNNDDVAVDIVVHGAAAFAPYGPLEERSDDEIVSVIETGLIAALRIAAALLPGMKKRNYGKFLLIGSAAASLGAAGQTIYATAKAGFEGLVKSLVVENAHSGINAHLLELGLIDTERTREAVSASAKEQLVARTPAGRIGQPKDVAMAVNYLLSPGADFLRGITLPVTGGLGLGVMSPKPSRTLRDS